MKVKSNREKEITKLEYLLSILHDHAYIETIIIVGVYLVVGYAIDPNDMCILNANISYILILLAVITLFHGFENGMLSLAIIALAIWLTYPTFQYIEFLVALLMTMIFSEFHYYWTQKIKSAEVNSEYRGTKLDELSKAFYTLKISHDQLEKNYVIKPMSIRNSIEHIMSGNNEIDNDDDISDKRRAYYKNFLLLLEKSFNVNSAAIVYKVDESTKEYITRQNSDIVFKTTSEGMDIDALFGDHLVDKAIERGTAIYISDALGEPTVNIDKNSQYLAAIPAMHKGKAVAVLVIKKMPFMSFNREILTSLSILLEYFTVETRKKDILCVRKELCVIKDEGFRFEYYRLKNLHDNYKVNSIVLVLHINNELQAIRIYEKVEKMLRSLDLVTIVKENNFYYITLLFPLHDKAAALGYVNRLMNVLDEPKDKKFNYMTFNLSETDLLNKYLSEDYSA
jgi:hypothetical protein